MREDTEETPGTQRRQGHFISIRSLRYRGKNKRFISGARYINRNM